MAGLIVHRLVHICFTSLAASIFTLGAVRWEATHTLAAATVRALSVCALTATTIVAWALAASTPMASAAAPQKTSTEKTSTVYAESTTQPQRLTIKPHGYYSHVSLHNFQWTNWGQPVASASATFTFQFCVKESCSVSPFYDQPASVSLSQIKLCRGRPLYTLLTLKIEGPLPDESFKSFQTSLGSCQPRSSGGHRKHR